MLSGYIVHFRIVKRHHDHRGLSVWVPYSDEGHVGAAATADDAAEVARYQLEGASEHVPPNQAPQPVQLGYVKVERVDEVAIDRLDG